MKILCKSSDLCIDRQWKILLYLESFSSLSCTSFSISMWQPVTGLVDGIIDTVSSNKYQRISSLAGQKNLLTPISCIQWTLTCVSLAQVIIILQQTQFDNFRTLLLNFFGCWHPCNLVLHGLQSLPDASSYWMELVVHYWASIKQLFQLLPDWQKTTILIISKGCSFCTRKPRFSCILHMHVSQSLRAGWTTQEVLSKQKSKILSFLLPPET